MWLHYSYPSTVDDSGILGPIWLPLFDRLTALVRLLSLLVMFLRYCLLCKTIPHCNPNTMSKMLCMLSRSWKEVDVKETCQACRILEAKLSIGLYISSHCLLIVLTCGNPLRLHIHGLQKVFIPLDLIHILLCYSLNPKWMKQILFLTHRHAIPHNDEVKTCFPLSSICVILCYSVLS